MLPDVHLTERADQPRQIGWQRVGQACEQKLNATASNRQVDADPSGYASRPCAGAVDDDIGSDDAVRRPHRLDPVGSEIESGDADSAFDRGTLRFGCLCDAMYCTMLVQIAVGGAEARAGNIEAAETRPPCPYVVRGEELARDGEPVLERHLLPEGLKPILVRSKEEVSDPPQPDVDAKSILELRPVLFAEDRQLDIGCRPQL